MTMDLIMIVVGLKSPRGGSRYIWRNGEGPERLKFLNQAMGLFVCMNPAGRVPRIIRGKCLKDSERHGLHSNSLLRIFQVSRGS